jgi:hypothetical protein
MKAGRSCARAWYSACGDAIFTAKDYLMRPTAAQQRTEFQRKRDQEEQECRDAVIAEFRGDNEPLPCLTCKSPQAAEVRHALGTGALTEARNRSPSGLPLTCCRVHLVGTEPVSTTFDARRS